MHPLRGRDGQVKRVKCEDTASLFRESVVQLRFSAIQVVAYPPYVTLVDTEWWSVGEAKAEYGTCSHKEHFVQHLLLASAGVFCLIQCTYQLWCVRAGRAGSGVKRGRH